jgi:heme/copper-type cytochrome/quinol oxidase subunit 2
VRVTLRERRLIAEPFLLVGIIASIKEIVVVAGAERPAEQEEWQAFVEAMIELGVLAGVILVLAISTLLLRRKEREPSEESA